MSINKNKTIQNKNNYNFKEIILNIANKKYPEIRKRTYSLSYYLDMFCIVLDDVTKWKSLSITANYPVKIIYHYKTIQNEYNKWSKDKIFNDAYNLFISENYVKITEILNNNKKTNFSENLKYNNTNYINTFTDTSCYNNKFGRENVGVNPELHKKNTTKIATLIDENGVVLSNLPVYVNIKQSSINDYEFTKKTFVHDVKTVQPLLDNLNINILNNKLRLCGDKGYITSEIYTHNNKEISIVVPKRKRSEKQLKKMTNKYKNEVSNIKNKIKKNEIRCKKYEKLNAKLLILEEKIKELLKPIKNKYRKIDKFLLGKRYLVENYFRNIKKYDRIMTRKEHNIDTFMSFINLANIKDLCEKLNKK